MVAGSISLRKPQWLGGKGRHPIETGFDGQNTGVQGSGTDGIPKVDANDVELIPTRGSLKQSNSWLLLVGPPKMA